MSMVDIRLLLEKPRPLTCTPGFTKEQENQQNLASYMMNTKRNFHNSCAKSLLLADFF